MRRSIGILVSAACLIVIFESILTAQDQPRQPQNRGRMTPAQRLEQLDKNDDGFLDRSEVPERMKQRFAQMDLDGDGRLSRDELQKGAGRGGNPPATQAQTSPASGLLGLLDSSGDGELSPEEIASAANVLLKLDKNSDGKLDRDELLTLARSSGGRPGEIIAPAAKGERQQDKLKVGDPAPDFTLPLVSGKGEVTLSSFQGKRPVVLIFGSYT